jgi:hypothetical protein
VLGAGGKPRPNFGWTDPADTRTQAEVLQAEGVDMSSGAAKPAQRMSADELLGLV